MNPYPLCDSNRVVTGWNCILAFLAVTLPFCAVANAEMQRTTINAVERGSLLLQPAAEVAAAQAQLVAAPLLDTSVAMNVTGMLARVHVRQTFRQQSDSWVNGIYVFPLPENAAVDHLTMSVGERIIEGQIQERQAARLTFEGARDSGKKAALVEQQRPNLFTTNVANIGPGEVVVVEIEYQQTLSYSEGWFSLRFPLTVGVRYIPGSAPVAGFDAGGWSYNSDEVADASAITPPMTGSSAGHDNPVSITVDLHAGMALADIKSRYHAIKSTAHPAQRYLVELAAGPTAADRDFELRFKPAPEQAPRAAFFRQDVGGESYGLLILMPPEVTWSKQHSVAREVIFVVDTSGSMHGSSMTQARAALGFGLEHLHPNDTFNIVQFNSTTEQFAAGAVSADAQQLAKARRYLANLNADGGTEMAAALNAVLDGREEHPRLRQIVFITDGSVGNEQALLRIIDQRLGASRLFTVGIGSAPNSYFMSEAAHLGRGTFTYIGDVAEVQEKMSELIEKLEFPMLADIRLDGGAGTFEAWPDPLADLYVHEPIMVSMRLGQQQKLNLAGRFAGKHWSTEVPVAVGGQAHGLDVLWARQKMASLERSLARGADRAVVREAITELGLKHHLVSAHTSLVAVDVTPTRPPQEGVQDAHVPNKMADGWTMGLPGSRLPQTATPLLAYWMVSGILALAGLCARRRG